MLLTKEREEEITLLAYGWRFGSGNERDAVRQQSADAIYDLLGALAAAEERIAALEAERDGLRAAVQRVVDGIKIHKCIWYDGVEGLYALQGLLDVLATTPAPAPDARREGDGEQPS